jgi:ABC-type multidrug transport system fused ATPase/permease subunit
VTQAGLRNALGLVMQETILFSASVRDNMLFARPGASDREILDALECAEAREFVEAMPEGLDTQIGERGVRLSGGQRQRLALARVFLKDPSIIIFDEATSSLDANAEKQIMKTMHKLARNRTSIIITHRISTITDSDCVFFISAGRLVARGTHRKLYHACDEYRDLCVKQEMREPARPRKRKGIPHAKQQG